MEVSIIGTVGVPANYGGFETLVENILGDNCSREISYCVYCSSKSYPKKKKEYKGAKLIYIPFDANGMQSIIYDVVSMIHAAFYADVLLVLGVSGCIFLPLLRVFYRKKLIVNIDGLEHRREKWGKTARRFLKFSEKMAVTFADIVIADNKGIQDYVKEEYGKEAELIAYGGDHVCCMVDEEQETKVLKEYHLGKKGYSLGLCRIEPENNVHLILEAFAGMEEKLVFIGNWQRSDYGEALYKKYSGFTNICLLTPVYDLNVLSVLRGNCMYYLHGHSAGGTNPSLVEAMFFGRPVFAFNVVYNRETTEEKACYFTCAEELKELINQSSIDILRENGENMKEIAKRRYLWRHIAQQYEELY